MFLLSPALEAQPVKIQTPSPASYSYSIRQETDPYQPPVGKVIQRNLRDPLIGTLKAIFNLRERTFGWDGYRAPAPDTHAISAALRWTQDAFVEVNGTLAGWREPRVSSDESGNVSLEWRNGTRSLELFVTPHSVEYLKVWGPRLLSDMSDGDVAHPSEFRALWNWLYA